MSELTLKNVTLRSNARIEELRTYLLLSNVLFNGKEVIIGDHVNQKEPDIFTKDYQIGLEVVSCDLLKYFKQSQTQQGSINPSKKANKNNVHKPTLKQFIKLSPADPKQLRADEAEFYASLQKVLTNKHERLNDGSYSACKQRNLMVLSDYGQKSFVDINKVHNTYKKVAGQFEEKFDNTFLSLNGEVYNITTKEKVNLVQSMPKTTNSKNEPIR